MPIITINEKPLHVTDTAAITPGASSKTIFFIHGLGSSENYYRPLFPYLKSYRLVTFETEGSARSPLTFIPQSIQGIAKDVIAILDHLKVEKAVIVGHSMGGITANWLASVYPTRVKGVVLIGPVHPNPGAAGKFEKRIETIEAHGMESMANTIPWAATGSKSNSLHHAFIRELLLNQTPAGYISLCNVIKYAPVPDYAAVSCPVLIIAGAEDQAAPIYGVEAIRAGLGTKDKQLVVLDGVGHWQCVEASDDVGKLVEGFVGRLSEHGWL